MDELTVFEQSIAAALREMGGPGRRIDAMEMVRAVSRPPHSWRFQSMFNAAKIVLAGAILAVFGGILVSTVSPPRSNRDPAQAGGSPSASASEAPASAAASEAPASPATSEAPASGLVTEDVEPGVVRIVKDGAGHDLDKGHPRSPYDTDGLSVGGDGTVWVLSTYHGGDNQAHPLAGWMVWALGRPGIFGVKDGLPANASNTILATADGSLLFLANGGIVRFDGSKFTPAADTSFPLADGTLQVFSPSQAAGASPNPGSPTETFLMINANGHWTSVDDRAKLVDLDGSFCIATNEGVVCEGDRFGAGRTYLSGMSINQIAKAPDGTLWAAISSDGGGGLYRITLP
jgi:hypothetical protein